jgi:hypothetical protein
MFSKELGDPGATEFDHPSRTYRGDGRCKGLPCTAQGSSVIRMRQGTVPRGQAPRGRGFGTGFSHTVEFSRNVAGLLFGDHLWFPLHVTAKAAGTVPRAVQIVKDFPPARERTPGGAPPATLTPSHRSAALRPTFVGVRTATESRRIDSYWRSATSCLPMSTPLASSRRGPRSSKNFPACSFEKVAPRSTACQLADLS